MKEIMKTCLKRKEEIHENMIGKMNERHEKEEGKKRKHGKTFEHEKHENVMEKRTTLKTKKTKRSREVWSRRGVKIPIFFTSSWIFSWTQGGSQRSCKMQRFATLESCCSARVYQCDPGRKTPHFGWLGPLGATLGQREDPRRRPKKRDLERG